MTILREGEKNRSAVLLYHFFYPDDVVSARHFSDFAEELVKRGWNVKVLTSNRYCRHPDKKIPLDKEYWKGIEIIRVSRPGWNQANDIFRILNSLWIIVRWVVKFARLPKCDAVIVGSDPQFSQFIFPILKILKKQKVLVYWCFDVYPDAIIANAGKGFKKWIAYAVKFLIRKKLYHFLDLMVDIGPCMRKRLEVYNDKVPQVTLTPWALVEPEKINEPDPQMRYELFGDAKLALLYSGNMGKAHDFSLFLELARRVRKYEPKITFCFACRGNRHEELKRAIRGDDFNIKLVPFAKESELEKRLNSADIHLISLRPEWEGIVVPSKFFGSLASGKPLLYAGPESSSIGKWILDFKIGFILKKENIDDIQQMLLEYADSPKKLEEMGKRAFDIYHQLFSKKVVMDEWDRVLRNMIERKREEDL